MHTLRLRALRVAAPTPLQGATLVDWQSQIHGVCWKMQRALQKVRVSFVP